MPRFTDEVLNDVPDLLRRPPEADMHRDLDSSAAHVTGDDASRVALNAGSVLHLQRAVGNAGTTAYLQREDEEQAGDSRSPIHDVIGHGGSPIDRATLNPIEQHLGADLSDVRLHVDRSSAESVNAAAYTVGNDVVVHPDHFSPGTPQAQRTLAHELTHVVQQRSGPVDGTPHAGGVNVSDPHDSFEKEAEESAHGFMSAQRTTLSASGGSGFGASVQRMDEEEGDEEDSSQPDAQLLSLQREEDEEGGDEDEG